MVVVHGRDNSWEQLETCVVETSDEELTVEARTDSFSLFAVAELSEETNETDGSDSADDGSTDTSDETASTDDGLPGFGLPVSLAGLFAAGLLALRRRS